MSGWDLADPFCLELEVRPEDIDAYGHVNNAVYLTWLDRTAWAHSAALGMPLERCLQLRRGMAAHRIEIDYLTAAHVHQSVQAGTWIVASDGRLRVQRRFQLRRGADTLVRAAVQYVCISLDSGRAVRMPEEFVRCYRMPAAATALSS
ncbi:MAG: acyl-CoA thioesterase [Gammaproteobacteria bacterium]|nr:acyl-CoA thioesterase [Gammaproteobacteria bacterium]MBV9696154.1 acyl-CoA thioesterase [Gammaproteobacteria bacterium]